MYISWCLAWVKLCSIAAPPAKLAKTKADIVNKSIQSYSFLLAASIWILYNFQIQKTIVSEETIRGNTVTKLKFNCLSHPRGRIFAIFGNFCHSFNSSQLKNNLVTTENRILRIMAIPAVEFLSEGTKFRKFFG